MPNAGIDFPSDMTSPDAETSNKRQYRKDDEDEEDLGQLPGFGRTDAEAEEPSNQSDDKEHDCQPKRITKQGLAPWEWGDA